MRPNASSSDDEDRPHGQSRTRGMLAPLCPSITELRNEHGEHQPIGRGTTPKVRNGSTPDGRIIGGIVPIVKALTSVSNTIPREPDASSSSTPDLGLHSVPAPAEISRITVIATGAVLGLCDSHALCHFPVRGDRPFGWRQLRPGRHRHG
jgi:hypothetical protein